MLFVAAVGFSLDRVANFNHVTIIILITIWVQIGHPF
jgi:hypothetical protein